MNCDKIPRLIKLSLQKYSNLLIRFIKIAKSQLILSKQRFYQIKACNEDSDSFFKAIENFVDFFLNEMIQIREVIESRLDGEIPMPRWIILKSLIELWTRTSETIAFKQFESYKKYKNLIETERFPQSWNSIRNYYLDVYETTKEVIDELDNLKKSKQWKYAIIREDGFDSDTTIVIESDTDTENSSDSDVQLVYVGLPRQI